jgi:plastocyanin
MSVTAREWSLSTSRPVLAAGAQTIELRNWGEDPHNLVISPDDGSHSPLVSWGSQDPGAHELKDTALAAGRYLLWCSLEGHEAAGMATTVQVE